MRQRRFLLPWINEELVDVVEDVRVALVLGFVAVDLHRLPQSRTLSLPCQV